MDEIVLNDKEKKVQIAPPRQHQTDSGIPLKSSYSASSIQAGRIEQPGEYPYTRGISPIMYREELWHRDLYSGFGNVEEAKRRYENLLAGGASGVNMAFDLPTQLGYDSDDPAVFDEVGKVGIAIDSLADLEDLFRDISVRDAHTIFTVGNGIGPVALSWFMLLAQKQGVNLSEYVVHLQNDPLKEFTGRGAFVFPIAPSVRMACDVVEYVARQGLFHWKPIGICGSQFRWGGGTAIHEIAFAITSARYYIEELLKRDLDIDDFAPLLELHLTVDMDLFEEVAKFRAARRVWARMMREDFGARKPESTHLRISLYTAGYRLTAQEPLNNSVRIALQALAAVLGGAQHLGTLSIDEALSTPSEEAARLAVQTQNIIGYETSIASVADPLGGSWLVESLTDEIEQRVLNSVAKVQNMGGMLQALRSGYLQSVIDESAYKYQTAIEKGERPLVGVNCFQQNEDRPKSTVKPFKVSGRTAERQIERLTRVRHSRDSTRIQKDLVALENAARGPSNLMPYIKTACEHYATIGEICGTLRKVFGTWKDDNVRF